MTGRDRQTVADLAVEHCGNANNMFPIMKHNDIEASADVAGMELIDEEMAEKKTVDYIHKQAISPACLYESTDNVLTDEEGGINILDNTGDTITD